MHLDPASPYSAEQQSAICAANFEVYNLLTMFLADADVEPLCRLITEDPSEFSDRAARLGVVVRFVYYLTGGVAAGKTTAVNQFGSCYVYDEWVEPSPPIVSKPFSDLTPTEKDQADTWVGQQFALKNRTLRSRDEGIHVLDRAPLDPLSFETSSKSRRAEQLIESFRPGLSPHKVVQGQVILLECPEEELRRRLISKSKFWSEKTIGSNVAALKELYGTDAYSVDSHVAGVSGTAKNVSRLIFMAPYVPLDLDKMLTQQASKK
jgi:hypothetical protein